MRVTSSGNPGTPFVIGNRTDRQAHPDVLFDGNNFIVVWSDEGAGQQALCGARVTPSGDVLDPNGKLIIGGTTSWGYPKLAYDGSDLMMAYKKCSISDGVIYGQRLTTSIDKIGDSFTISTASNKKLDLRIAYSGSNYLVAWIEGTYLSYKIKARRVSKAGSVVGSEITVVTGLGQSASLDLCYDGTYYLLVYSDGTDVKGQNISTDGQLVGSSFTIGSGSMPAVCYDSSNLLITYSKKPSSEYDLYGTVDFSNIMEETRPASERKNSTIYASEIRLQPGTKLYDISGRLVKNPEPGIYFLQHADGNVDKIIKVR